jgi:hypothetical protein
MSICIRNSYTYLYISITCIVVKEKEVFNMKHLFRKALMAYCMVAALNCGVKQSPAPKPEDFKPTTIERTILPNLGEITVYSGSDGLPELIRQMDMRISVQKAAWAPENRPDTIKSYNAYILSPKAQEYVKEMQEAGSKLAYELARIQYEADTKK